MSTLCFYFDEYAIGLLASVEVVYDNLVVVRMRASHSTHTRQHRGCSGPVRYIGFIITVTVVYTSEFPDLCVRGGMGTKCDNV